MNHNEWYEEAAEEFYRKTGMMAPGKDMGAGAGSHPTMEERTEAWMEFCKEKESYNGNRS